MKRANKTLLAMASVCILMAGAGVALFANPDESEASPNMIYIPSTFDHVYFVSVGHTISVNLDMADGGFDVTSKPSWISLTGTGITGSAPAAGTYAVDYTFYDPSGNPTSEKMYLYAVNAGDIDLTTVRYYDGRTNAKVIAIDYTTSSTYTVSSVTVGEMVATEYYYDGSYVVPSQTISINTPSSNSLSNIGLFTNKTGVPLLEIPYTAPSGNAIAGVNWSWTSTTLSGATMTVSGVDWLSVNGTNVYGVPPATGEYTITVTITKAGYADLTETFVLTAVSKLVPTNSPTFGAIFCL